MKTALLILVVLATGGVVGAILAFAWFCKSIKDGM